MNRAAPSAPAVDLFDVNLLAGRLAVLRRRRSLRRVSSVASLALLVLGGVVAVIAVAHVTALWRARLGLRALQKDLDVQRQVCAELDDLRETVAKELGVAGELIPAARARAAWAPKLAALARELPPGTGILSIDASTGDLPLLPAAKASAPPEKKPEPPRMSFTILYPPAFGGEGGPAWYLERLRAADAFATQTEVLRLEETHEQTWHGKPVVALKGLWRGEAANR